MKQSVTRRNFLSGVAAAGATGFVSSSVVADALQKTGAGEDTENRTLTDAEVAKVQWKAKPFSMTEVRLLPSFWKDTMELNRSFLYALPNERLAHNFRVTAGIPSSADPL